MNRSTVRTFRPARWGALCFLLAAILFLLSYSQPRATEAGAAFKNIDGQPAGSRFFPTERWRVSDIFRTESRTDNSTTSQPVNRGLAAFASENPALGLADSPPLLALNKVHVTNPNDPIPDPNNQPPVTWQLGVSITYILTLTNSGGPNSHISVNDTLPPGFVFVSSACASPSSNAVCPTTAQSPPSGGILTLGEFNMPNGSKIELRITGYFTTTGSQVNKAVASAKDDSGNPIPIVGTPNPNGGSSNEAQWGVTVPSSAKLPNLKVTKIVSPASTSFPAHLDYTIEVTNTTTTGVFLGGILTVRDDISTASSIGLNWSLNLLPCVPTLGAVCPDLPASVPGGTSQILFSYSSGNSGWLPGGASYKIKFSVDVTRTGTEPCGGSTVDFFNKASLNFSSGLADTNAIDDISQKVQTTINTGLTDCPQTAGPTVSKQQIDPSSGLPVTTANWNSPVKYRITITNPTGASVSIALFDIIWKGGNTPAFTATSTSAPICVGCTSLSTPNLQSPNVNSSGTFTLWDATAVVPALNAGQTAVIDYTVTYKPACETNGVQDVITNRIVGGASWMDVSTTLPEWNDCELQVDKSKVTTGPIIFGQPFTYNVVFTNLSTTTAVNAFVRDVLSIRSNRYGSFLVDSAVSCSATSGSVTPVGATPLIPFTKVLTGATVVHKPVGWRGLRLLDEYLRFDPGAVLTCQVTIKPQQPASTNPFCQGADDPLIATDDAQLINFAYMDPSNFDESGAIAPKFNSSQPADLPRCRNLIVKKVANAQKFGPGATIDYTITVQNVGDDPVSSFALTDLIPLPLTPLTATSVSPCTPNSCISGTPSLSGNLLNVQYAPLLPNTPVSFVLQVLAPQAGGPYPNEAVGAFLPGGNFYFQGDPDFLKDGENIDVLTPTLAKSFDPAQIGPNGTSTLTFNVTNTNSDPKQSGIAFSDTLPPGLQIVSVISNGCGGTVAISTDGHTVSLTGGQLVGSNADGSGKHNCQISVTVKATGECGVFQNNKNNFSNVVNLDVTNINQQLAVTGCTTEPTKPTLTKLFGPAQIGPNGTSTLGFTITNGSGDPKQTGISFSDTLPAGLQIVSVIANGCGGNVSISGDGKSVTLTNGQLVGANTDGSGQHSCQITVNVKATGVCGVYRNNKDNFSQVTNIDVSGINQQLEVVDCRPPTKSCGVKTNEISCKADGTGGYLYSFTVSNNTGQLVTDILLTPPANSNITLSQQQFSLLPAGLAPGASMTSQVTINGGKPEEPACFYVTLMTQEGECCTTRVCPVLPECCAVAKEESIECNSDGTFTYTMSVVNTGVDTIEHIYLYPPAGVSMTPNYFHVSLKPGNTFTTKVTIKGAKPGDKLCFDISLHTANMEKCCQGQQCIVLPACSVSGSRRP